SNLTELFRELANTNAPPERLEQLLDSRAALKVAAVRGFVGDWDTFTMQRGRNAFLYRRPADGKFQFLHWDGDEGFLTGQPFYGERVKRWIEEPQNLKVFFDYLLELARVCSEKNGRVQAYLETEKQATAGVIQMATYPKFFERRR